MPDQRRVLRTPAGAALVAGLSLVAQVVVVLRLAAPTFGDVHVYRAEGAALLHGLDLYGPLPGVDDVSTYPPFAALVFVPTALTSTGLLDALSVVANVGLLVLVCWQSVRLVRGGGPGIFSACCVLTAVALWCEPVALSMSYGQINLLLLALVLWDFNRPADSRLRGVGVGLAAGLKVTPGILIVYLVLTRRFRAAATAVATVLATIGLSALVDADATRTYWTRDLFDLGRAGRLENSINQSVRGWLVRASHSREPQPLELLVVVVVLIAGLACAVFAYRHLGDPWGLPAAAVTGLLVSPVSWSHHWVWCVPALALLWDQARAFVVLTLAVFWSYAVWLVPQGDSVELHLSGLEVARSGWYVAFGLGFLALAAWRARAAMPSPEGSTRSAEPVEIGS